MEQPADHCRNCGASLGGEYCAACGQREGRADLHFGEAAGDILGDVVRLDSRLWRTLSALLLRPGFLSAEFIAGRRVRYLPPFRLYLILSFITFLLLSLSPEDTLQLGLEDGMGPEQESSGANEATDAAAPPHFSIDEHDDDPAWVVAVKERLEGNVRRAMENPDRYGEVILEYLPQMLFLLLPVSALLLHILYFTKPFHYLQHLIFALHYHSFVYLLLLVDFVVEAIARPLEGLLVLALVIYLPLALRRCYGGSWLGAISRAAILMVSYGLTLLIGFAAVMVGALALM